jgi:hypothetical protein
MVGLVVEPEEIEIEEIIEVENEGANIIKELTLVEQLNKGVMGCALNYQPVHIKGRQKLSIETDGTAINDTITDINALANIIINGTITDENNLPIPGVNVVIKGTKIGTQTDLGGNYSITPEANQTLIFHFLGYETKEITVSNTSNTIGFQMKAMVEGNVRVLVRGRPSIKFTQKDLDARKTNNHFSDKSQRNEQERKERIEKRRDANANEMAFQKIKQDKKKANKAAKKLKRKRK